MRLWQGAARCSTADAARAGSVSDRSVPRLPPVAHAPGSPQCQTTTFIWTLPIWITSLTLSALLLAGVDARPVDEGAVGAVEVLDGQLAVLEADAGVLPRTPDAIRRLLVFQVDVHRLLVGPADEILPFVDRVFDVALLAAQHDQLRLGAGRQAGRRRGRPPQAAAAGGRGGRGRRRAEAAAHGDRRRRGRRRPGAGGGGGAAATGGRADRLIGTASATRASPPSASASTAGGHRLDGHGLHRHGLDGHRLDDRHGLHRHGLHRHGLDRPSAAIGMASTAIGRRLGARRPRRPGPTCTVRRTAPRLRCRNGRTDTSP